MTGFFGVAVGCGGVGDAGGLFNSGGAQGSTSSGGGATASASSGPGAGGGTTVSASSGGGAGVGGMGTVSSSTGAPDTSSSSSSSSTAASSSSTAASSSSTGGPTTFDCAGKMCPLGNMNACCWSNLSKMGTCVVGPPANDMCNTDPQPNGYQTRIECSGPADCNGMICCGNLNQTMFGSYYNTVTCQASCNSGSSRVLCDPNAPTPCPNNGMCQQSQYLPQGYFVCN